MSCRNYSKFNSVGRYCYYCVDDAGFSRGELRRRRRLHSSPLCCKPDSVEYLCRPHDPVLLLLLLSSSYRYVIQKSGDGSQTLWTTRQSFALAKIALRVFRIKRPASDFMGSASIYQNRNFFFFYSYRNQCFSPPQMVIF